MSTRRKDPRPAVATAPDSAAATNDAPNFTASDPLELRTDEVQGLETNPPFWVVGVGASAGGLEAFTQLLRALPVDTGMVFVLVQHLAPTRESALAEILSRATAMPVSEATDGVEIEPNRVYVIPSDRNMVLAGGRLHLMAREAGAKNHPIDQFFRSLAEGQRHMAIGVVLSGTATDGTLGLERVKVEGGITFAQDGTAQEGGMPHSAIASGCVDFVLPTEGIAGEIARIAASPYVAFRSWERANEDAKPAAAFGKGDLSPILALLRKATGVDFTEYTTSTLVRRITRRMVLLKKVGLAEYEHHLRDSATEAQALYQDILINVTGFFRDPEMFEVLRHKAIPALIEERSRQEALRVWVLGCSTGEEAYSLGMVLSELLDPHSGRVPAQVFATDLSASSIEHARAGAYSKARLQGLTPERIRRFFVETNGSFRVTKPLRDMCVFSRHNVLGDPPFSRMDLISCRNLLIYLEPSLQQRVISILHYALKPGGILVLGGSETVARYSDVFRVVDGKHKIFEKKAGSRRLPPWTGQGRSSMIGAALERVSQPAPGPMGRSTPAQQTNNPEQMADRLLATYGPPAVLVGSNLEILQFRGDTEPYLIPAQGKATLSILKMVREGLQVPLRSLLHRARTENAPAREDGLRVRTNAGDRTVGLEVLPLPTGPGQDPCFLVVFVDSVPVAAPAGSAGDPLVSTLDAESPAATIARLEQELSRSRVHLKALVEQHDAADEALQSTNEEAQSVNEELQSLNEELETSKEEIQSSNEELTTINDELNNRNQELGLLNADLQNLITSVQAPIVIVGRDLRVRRFSPMAETLLNICPADVGRPISEIALGLTLTGIDALMQESIDTATAKQREVQVRDGGWYSLRIRPYLTVENKIDGAVLSMLDIDTIRRARQFAETIVATVREPLLVLDRELRVRSASRAFYEKFGLTSQETEGRPIQDLGKGEWNIPYLRRLLQEVVSTNSAFNEFTVDREFTGLGPRIMMLNARALREPDGNRQSILLSIEDVTERKREENALALSELRYRRLFESAKDGILILDAVTARITEANPFIVQLLGYPLDELIGKELWEIGLFEDAQQSKEAMRELQDERFIRYDSLPLETKGGTSIEVEFVSNVYEEAGWSVIQCNIRDITDRKLLESALGKRNEDLAIADEAKNQFIAVLSHELRSPLNAIRGWVQILRRPNPQPGDLQTGLEVIDRNSRAQSQLIDDLLDIHRITAGKIRLELAPIDLRTVISDVVDAVTPTAAEKRIRLEREVDAQPVGVSGDAARLKQVLENLLGNALKFTPQGGEIRVVVQRSGALAQLIVSDTGRGIAPEDLPHVFERFRQGDPKTNRNQGGLGLGLAISKQLVELHGGTISAHSDGREKGATFTASFPLRAAGALEPTALAKASIGAQSRTLEGILVLVVDDEPDAREPVRRVLEAAGAEAMAVASAEEALKTIDQRRPDVIVSDIGMPGRDGYELLRSIRALSPGRGGLIPAIALTAYAAAEDRARALEAGFQNHLAKPVDSTVLITAVAALVDRAADGSRRT